MIAHHVLFWLKATTTAEQKEGFVKSLQTLKDIAGVEQIHIGTPAPISRSVVDTTYTFSLLIFFKDMEAHDVYQVHPLHKAFLDEYRETFDRVIIYDAQ